MSNWENDTKRAQLEEEAYQAWLNQPPIQFPLHPDLPIRNGYSNSSYSHVGGIEIEFGMDELLWHTSAMDAMLLDSF